MLVSITKRGVALLVTLCGLAAWSPAGVAEPVNVRIVAANLTSGNEQSYSLDNANHSNLEGAISVHLKAGGSAGIRRQQAEELVRRIRDEIPDQDYVVIGGDFNTSERREPCIAKLGEIFQTGEPYPEDQAGDPDTNANRRKPYDWMLADAELHPCQVATQLGTYTFTTGLVVDTRVFRPLEIIAPAQESDSGVTNMQHMAVVKDFTIP